MEEQRIQLDRRLFIVSETIRVIERGFAHWEDALLKSDTLGQTADLFFAKAKEAESRSEFQTVMWELFGQLRNAHSWYFDKLVPKPQKGSLGLSVFELNDEWVVNGDKSGLLTEGDVVLSIEGKHPSEWIKELEPYMCFANPVSRNIRTMQMLPYFIHSATIEVQIEDQNRTQRTVMVPRIAYNDERFLTGKHPSETEGKWLREGKVAYVRIPGFDDPRYEKLALQFVQEYRQVQTLIIDVRGNGGGSTPSQLIKQLMDRPYRWWRERSRHPEWLRKRHKHGELRFDEHYQYAEWLPNWQEPASESDRYNGQVLILVDRFVGSAAEDFIMPFKDNGRATVIGERTGGSTGQPMFRTFGEDIQIGIGSIRAYFPDGTPFEGVGIKPDVGVALVREDLYSKRDAVLDKALELATL